MSQLNINAWVIDDDEKREVVYIKLISLLNDWPSQSGSKGLFPGAKLILHFCSTFDQCVERIDSLDRGEPTIVIRDVMLTEGYWSSANGATINHQLEKHRLPTVLVSQNFGDDAEQTVNDIVKHLAYFPPIFNWKNIENIALNNTPASEIVNTLRLFFGKTFGLEHSIQKSPNEKISILHITDLHFGEANVFANTAFGLATLVKDVLKLPLPDFIVITGDISSRGNVSGYAEATESIKSLRSLLLSEKSDEPSKRIFLVSGNHDFSSTVALASSMKLVENNIAKSNNTKSEKKTATINFEVAIDSAGNRENWKWGIKSFTEFAAKISASHQSSLLENGYLLWKGFAHLGIYFLEWQLEKFEIRGTNFVLNTSDAIKKVVLKLSDDINKIPNASTLIVLTHRPPTDYDAEVNGLLNSAGKKFKLLWLCGHIHEPRVIPSSDGAYLTTIGNCLGQHNNTKSGHQPSAFLLEFDRQDGMLSRVTPRLLQFTNDRWTLTDINQTPVRTPPDSAQENGMWR